MPKKSINKSGKASKSLANSLPKLGKRSLSARSDNSEEAAPVPEPNETVPNFNDWEVFRNAEGKYHNAYLM